MASVFKPEGSTRYVVNYTDERGTRRKKTAYTDKSMSVRLAADLETKAQARRDGLIDPAAERFAQFATMSVQEHLTAFTASLTAKGRDPKHVRNTTACVLAVIGEAHADRLDDLGPSAVTRAVHALEQQRRLSARSVNAYVVATKSFMRWAWKENRVRSFELANLGRRNEEADRKYVRRPLSEDELRALIESTRSAPPWLKMSGPDRAWFYTLATTTGLRRSELGSLTPVDFDLTGPMPVVRLDGSRTKNGRACEQPLPRWLIADLSHWLATKARGSPVFTLPDKTALMLHADLKRCNIDPVDARGRIVDIHSLRHSFGTALAMANVPLKAAQTLMRHSDPKLTMNIYSHLSAHDLHGAVADALPDLSEGGARKAAQTGTDGGCSISNATQNATGRKASRRKP